MIKLLTTDKPSKKEAFNLVYSARREKRELTDHEKDMLLNYFAPARPKNPATPEQWVAKACADKQDLRYYLRYVHVKDSIAYGTDGHRIHWAPTEFADGYYDPATLLACECDGRFPDVQRAIPNDLSGLTTDVGGEPASVSKVEGKDFRYLKLEKGVHVQESYWLQALAGDENTTYSDSTDTPGKVRGVNRFGEFVIIGCRV